MIYELLTDRAIIEVSGNDAMNFLHNLTSNDIKKNDYCYNYALSNQGRYLFDFFIFKMSETRFLIDLNINQCDSFKKHLAMYKLRAKIEVNDLSDMYQVTYSQQKLQFNTIMSFKDPRYTQLGFRSIINKNTISLSEITGLYLQDKYNFVIIDGYEDLIYNRSIPIEYGCEELNAVSYNKGCYIGQEVISRVKYQGVVRKKIFKLSAINQDIDISKNDEIIANNEKIGVICSHYKGVAIALIREDQYSSLQDKVATIKNINVTLSIPPWRT